MADVMLRAELDRAGLAGLVEVDSAGTGDWHLGEPMAEQAGAELARRGYDGSAHRARRIQPSWFAQRDLVLAMDLSNLAALRALAPDADGGRAAADAVPVVRPGPGRREVPRPLGRCGARPLRRPAGRLRAGPGPGPGRGTGPGRTAGRAAGTEVARPRPERDHARGPTCPADDGPEPGSHRRTGGNREPGSPCRRAAPSSPGGSPNSPGGWTGSPAPRCATSAPAGAQHQWAHYQVTLADGRLAFAKAAREDLGGVFEAEARGLRWLADAHAVPLPEVLGWDTATLAVTWLPQQAPDQHAAEQFGRDLAVLHASGAERFGTPWPGFIATLPLGDRSG